MAIQQKLAQASLEIAFRGAPYLRVMAAGTTDSSLNKSSKSHRCDTGRGEATKPATMKVSEPGVSIP